MKADPTKAIRILVCGALIIVGMIWMSKSYDKEVAAQTTDLCTQFKQQFDRIKSEDAERRARYHTDAPIASDLLQVPMWCQ